MGAVISHLRSIYNTATALLRTISALNARYGALLARVHAGPFTPVEKPTESFWMRDPPFPELGDVVEEEEEEADVVVVGSGITGVSAVKTILELSSSPKIMVLEARQLCSGATARNGGHIKCAPHEEFARLRKTLGEEKARRVVRLQMRHLPALKEVGERMPWGEVREVETVDLFLEGVDFERARGHVDGMREWLPEVDVHVWEAEQARKKFGVNRQVVGAISYQAGALWPYRLVTSLWHDLMTKYPGLTISTHTPVSSITPNASPTHPYTVHTSRGKIRTRHVLHATNAYTGHLVPSLRGCLTGVIGHMTAQKPGDGFAPVCQGRRSWSMMYGTGFDYVTQRPDGEDGQPGELMLGGGLFRSKEEGLDQVGVWDDGRVDAFPLMHLRGSMATIFEPRWGAGGTLEAAWSGIMGFTGDMLPFVGGLPPGVGIGKRRNVGGVGDGFGEWIAAGFNGEGMVWAWLSGVAVGIMVMGREGDELYEGEGRPGGRLGEWFPVEEVCVDGGRMRRARIENLASEI
ncbi:nucleotide-binding domain-containing protein [Trichoderma citrinoviride]|uniref:Nucleotide-binding domain-containing protein n=1 Tax=Trichoderma citrinoviride TaxID=58853 RepID=A0A2T4B328_9HYPO|nr:nucleotide-binding domain-containing protein [Trichoderma citrinoviride]PTB63710.1 nucleotide-binding domain-containing protein [Trichoderma citrinoviride]